MWMRQLGLGWGGSRNPVEQAVGDSVDLRRGVGLIGEEGEPDDGQERQLEDDHTSQFEGQRWFDGRWELLHLGRFQGSASDQAFTRAVPALGLLIN